ncbi:hypothetical protein FQA47_017344 [Oryzias melastigma]|uniref:Uncharacterized protein n=1 Tax=Oryzias melastigma TaxID=30732 RepID=A0A834CM31_ORYME|nr:hypothetical protein FQA47_017344 [Oryzias melastigma]
MRSRVRPNISRVMAEGGYRPATASPSNAGVARLRACAHRGGRAAEHLYEIQRADGNTEVGNGEIPVLMCYSYRGRAAASSSSSSLVSSLTPSSLIQLLIWHRSKEINEVLQQKESLTGSGTEGTRSETGIWRMV